MFDFNINDSQYRAFTLYKNKKYEHYTCKERNILRFKWGVHNLSWQKATTIIVDWYVVRTCENHNNRSM